MSEENKEKKPETEIRDLPVEKDVKGGESIGNRGTDPVNLSKGTPGPIHQPPIIDPKNQ